MHIRAMLILCLAAGEVVAGVTDPTLTIIPSSPLVGEEVEAIVATSSCTVLPPAATVLRDGFTVRIELEVPDVCSPPDVVPQRTYPIGTFGQGQYTVQLYYCSNSPPPLPRCSLVRSQAVIVQGSHHGVPFLKGTSTLFLMLATLLLGVVHVSRR